MQAAAVVKQSLKMGFAGDIWPVHPSKDEVAGVKAYRSVAELPGAPDAAFVGVNRYLTSRSSAQLSARGAGGAICYAAGFLEAGSDDADGERLQRELVEAAGDMPIIGPNCYGLINYADGALLWPDQHGGMRLAPGDARRRHHHAIVQHRLQPDHAEARPAGRLPDDGRQPGADRPFGNGARPARGRPRLGARPAHRRL